MARDPQWRYPTAEAMSAALFVAPQQYSTRPPTRVLAEPLPPPSTMIVPPPARANRRGTLLAVAAVLAAILLAAVLLIFDPGEQPSAPKQVGTSTSAPAPYPDAHRWHHHRPAPPVQIDEGPPGKKGNGDKKPKGGRGHE